MDVLSNRLYVNSSQTASVGCCMENKVNRFLCWRNENAAFVTGDGVSTNTMGFRMRVF